VPGTAWMMQGQNDVLTSLDDVPKYCSVMADELMKRQEQVVNLASLTPGKYKVMPWFSFEESNICWFLNKYARELLKQDALPVSFLPTKSLEEEYENRLYLPCSVKPYTGLEAIYKKVIADLRSGWVVTNIIDPKIRVKKDDEWLLFVKEIKGQAEDITGLLIRCLASKFKLNNIFVCSAAWIQDDGSCELCPDKVYMWIKKGAFVKVQEVFKFTTLKKPGYYA
jgi:hypothetical protein